MDGALIHSWPLSLVQSEVALHVFMPGHDVVVAPVSGHCQPVMLQSQVVDDCDGIPTILGVPGTE